MTTYEERKAEYAKLRSEYTIADRHYRAQEPGFGEWRAARLACNEIEKRCRALVFGFLSDPATRHGDWRTEADKEIMHLIGWTSYRANCKYAVQ